MTENEVKEILLTKHDSPKKYMMATKAYHMLGDISSTEPDIARIHSETDDYYVGNFVYGFGFIDVLFPKNTTRELTDIERIEYNGSGLMLGNSYVGKLDLGG